jgi:helix-turn-helix protein
MPGFIQAGGRMGAERIELSAKERERLKVLQQAEEGHLKQIEAARRLHVTDRQVRRLQARLRSEGDRGIVHRLRGRCSMPTDAGPRSNDVDSASLCPQTISRHQTQSYFTSEGRQHGDNAKR